MADVFGVNGTTLLAGGALGAGLIAALWSYVKEFGTRLLGLVLINVQMDSDTLSAVTLYLNHNATPLPSGRRSVASFNCYVGTEKAYRQVPFEHPGQSMLYIYRSTVILLRNNGQGSSVTFVRGTLALDTFVDASSKFWAQMSVPKDASRFRIERLIGTAGERPDNRDSTRPSGDTPVSPPTATLSGSVALRDVYRPIGVERLDLDNVRKDQRGIDGIYLDTPQRLAIDNALAWKDSKDWYKDRRIPWRRGLLLHGVPGTGKSTFVRALAQALELPVFILELSTMTSRDFLQAFERVRNSFPAVLLIEDIDGVFHGRENIIQAGGAMTPLLSFDVLLNVIAGVEEADGLFLCVTTNHLEHVDSALSRPGRLDESLEFTPLPLEGRRLVAGQILGDYPDLVERVLREGTDEPGAKFQELCTTLALERYWAEKKAALKIKAQQQENACSVYNPPISAASSKSANLAGR